MKNIYKTIAFVAIVAFMAQTAFPQVVQYSDNTGKHGITVKQATKENLKVDFSLSEFSFSDLQVDGEPMKSVTMPGVFLPNEAGAPDLPTMSRYVAVPVGASVSVTVKTSRTAKFSDQHIAPAPVIPLDTEDGPLVYQKDERIYSTNAFYPENPVVISDVSRIRGVDVVMLAITPFQYNPVTGEMIVYRDLELEINFAGGTGVIGEDRLRSRWWDQVLDGTLINPEILPRIDYNKKAGAATDTPDYEYLIITLDDPTFLSWADSIKNFRTLQGIHTGVVTLTDIGGNTVANIESYVDKAYNTWAVPPSAVLLLGDYSTGSTGITSQMYAHPAGYPDFVSDNKFADVDEDNLPDIAFARITANDAAQLEVMITKFLDYERNPPTNANFYDHPITALGWQTERWFQICSEVVGGYLKNVKGKNPVRINAVYSGNPTSDPWSTATNTSTVLNYFGPNGLGYIPATPQELGGFSGGTATDVVNAINSGSYMLQHRDHGMYTGWGEPGFTTTHIPYLTNVNNELPYIFSINCQTGAFHRSTESFAEKFHRYTYNGQNSGALGVLAATEVSYSFVNDTYVWGVFDNMFPDFMPDKASTFPVDFALPAFGNAAGKHFLYQSSWPYNTSDKLITYRLFHHHGDAFMNLYSEVPQNLSVTHEPVLQAGATQFGVTADAGSLIALTVNGTILATADGTGSEILIDIPQQNPGDVMIVTITKQDYFRYSANVEVVSTSVFAQFEADNTNPCAGSPVNFTDLSYGPVTSWDWSFPGGTPAFYSGQNPPQVIYNVAGTYDVSLTVSDGTNIHTNTKTTYISAVNLTADFAASSTNIVAGYTTTFTDLSSCEADAYSWSFPGGTPSTYTGKTPPEILYSSAGFYDVSLTVSNAAGSDTKTYTNYIEVVDCYSVTLPWTEDFESVGPTTTFTSNEAYINGACRWAYEKTVNGRLQFTAYAHGGSKAAALDASVSPDYSVNYLIGTFDLSAYQLASDLELSFWHMQYGEESHTNDRVWIRGSNADAWIEVYDLYANQPTSGLWVQVTGIDIDAALSGAGQAVTSSFQLRFGQEDNYPFTSDGRVFDDITITGSGNEPPDCATLSAPANAAVNVSAETNLDWNSVSSASGYKLYFGTDNPPTNIENGTDLGNVLFYDPVNTLQYSTTYYWRVVAYNLAGDAVGCSTWSFTTEDEPVLPPPCATLVSPADAATNIPVAATLNWNAVAEATGYKLSFGTNNPPTNILNGADLGNVLSYDPAGDMQYNTTYFWQVTAYNDGGDASGCNTWSFTTEIIPPVADFSANVTTIFEGETVNFTDLSSNTPTGWSWSFPGGTPSSATVQHPSVTYATAGVYDVSLVASNAAGSDTETKTAYITVNVAPPVANFTADLTNILIGETIHFTDLSSNAPTTWLWTFEGGTPATSTLQNPSVAYNQTGVFDVSLTVSNAGGTDSETRYGFITVTDGTVTYCNAAGQDWSSEWIAQVDFGTFSNPSGATGYSDFTNSVIQVENGLSYTVVLHPGFSGKSNREFWRVWIDYNKDGDFVDYGEEVIAADGFKNKVTTNIVIPAGASGETRMRVAMKYQFAPTPCEVFPNGEVEDYTISIGEPVPLMPVANFSGAPTSIAPGENVMFTDESANNPTSWSWSFPGGTPSASTMQNPTVSYSTAGTYDVSLTVSNSIGSDTETKTGYIVVSDAPPPPQGYCASEGLSNALEWISGVAIGAFTNNSGAAGYSDFTSMVINLSPGSTYSVTLIPGYSGRDEREFWRIWIDFNMDNDFEDTGEQVLTANNKKGSYTDNIIIPSNLSGQTRMRVTMKNGSSPSPCETFSGGEVEDYTVDFSAKGALGIDNLHRELLSVHPNPAQDVLNIHLASDGAELRMFDMRGRLVMTTMLEQSENTLDISHLEKGMYLISIITETGTYHEKIIRE